MENAELAGLIGKTIIVTDKSWEKRCVRKITALDIIEDCFVVLYTNEKLPSGDNRLQVMREKFEEGKAKYYKGFQNHQDEEEVAFQIE